MIRYRISTILLLVLTISIGLAWIAERNALHRRIRHLSPPIETFGEKFYLWSPSNYLAESLQDLERTLTTSQQIDFAGEFVTSSQGLGQEQLRRPTLTTLDAMILLLDDKGTDTQIAAAKLISLYLQGVCGTENLDAESYRVRVHFQAHGLRKTLSLLKSSDKDLRGAAALILGNTIHRSHTVYALEEAFDSEHDSHVKLLLAWAYWKIANNYDRVDL